MADEIEHAGPEARARRRFWRFVPVALIASAFVLAYAAGLQDRLSLAGLGESRDSLRATVAHNYWLAALVFVATYVVVTACSFPIASVCTIFAGFLFGAVPGALLSMVGATAGATILFLAARRAFGDFLRRKVRADALAARLAEGFRQDAFTYLLVLRLAPFVPFFIVNIAPALFNVRTRTFVAATLIGILPGAFAYAWLGHGADSVFEAARAAGRTPAVADLVTPEITIAFLILALVAVVAAVVKKVYARRVR